MTFVCTTAVALVFLLAVVTFVASSSVAVFLVVAWKRLVSGALSYRMARKMDRGHFWLQLFTAECEGESISGQVKWTGHFYNALLWVRYSSLSRSGMSSVNEASRQWFIVDFSNTCSRSRQIHQLLFWTGWRRSWRQDICIARFRENSPLRRS